MSDLWLTFFENNGFVLKGHAIKKVELQEIPLCLHIWFTNGAESDFVLKPYDLEQAKQFKKDIEKCIKYKNFTVYSTIKKTPSSYDRVCYGLDLKVSKKRAVKMKISILGREYEFKRTNGVDDKGLLANSDLCGESRYYKGEIVVSNECFPKDYQNFIARHEIIHAFLHESGLEGYKNNEDLVNYIALQFPKMLKVFKEVKAL